jgi:chromosomal replication initiator protein
MNAEQAWQSVLAQLQMEMPRASYDTWVRDTRPTAYENGIITVGVRNAYARDWLENRLATTVSRLLIGILNSNVAVEFVVSQANETDSHTDPDAEHVAPSIASCYA